jgi:hypothetical protein
MTKLKLIITFYRAFALASAVITLSCVSIIFLGGLGTFVVLFWFKIITSGIIFYFINEYKLKELYYYQNLGLSKLFLWTSTLTLDFAIFLLLMFITLLVK